MKLPTVVLVVAVLFFHVPIERPRYTIMSDPLNDPAAEKAALRKHAGKTRAALAADDTDAAGRLAALAGIVAEVAMYLSDSTDSGGAAPVIAAYLPICSELSPLPLIEALAADGFATAMPVTPESGNPLLFRAWAPGAPLADGPYNTKQPPSDAVEMIPSIILAPMLAFDSSFWRLGYGGGFYDRTLSRLRAAGRHVVALGIAYDGQLVDKVPTGPYDMQLDGVLTPSGLRSAGRPL